MIEIGGMLAIVAALYFGRMAYIWLVAEREQRVYESLSWCFSPELIFLHTREPKKGEIPRCSWLSLARARLEASTLRVPILMTSGYTGYVNKGQRITEAERFRNQAWEKWGYDVVIILGQNPGVRTTAAEVDEACSYCSERNIARVLVVVNRAHLARAKKYWDDFRAEGMQVVFAPVYGPIQMYSREVLTYFIHSIARPGSRLENWLLDLKGRR